MTTDTPPADEFSDRPELVQHRARTLAVQRLLIVLVIFYSLAVLTILLFSTRIAYLQRELLIDCTKIGGQCYDEAQQRTGEAVTGLNEEGAKREATTREWVVAKAYCDRVMNNPTIDDLTRCVEEKVK